MSQLERYEWCQLWWEEAEKRDLPRLLLIGDSITNGYHPFVNEKLKEIAYVDKLATSKAIDNPSLRREIQYMLQHDDFTYQLIHLNNGLHGWHLSLEQYRDHFEQVIQSIQGQSDAVMVLATSTPIATKGAPTQIDPVENAKVTARNEVVWALADKYSLRVNDLYQKMLGHPEYRVDHPEDIYHFNEAGQRYQATIVTDVCRDPIHVG